jgi:hypothetical protein
MRGAIPIPTRSSFLRTGQDPNLLLHSETLFPLDQGALRRCGKLVWRSSSPRSARWSIEWRCIHGNRRRQEAGIAYQKARLLTLQRQVSPASKPGSPCALL